MSVSGTVQMHWFQYRLCEYAGYDSLYDTIVHGTRWSKVERLVIMLGCRFDSETGLCIQGVPGGMCNTSGECSLC